MATLDVLISLPVEFSCDLAPEELMTKDYTLALVAIDANDGSQVWCIQGNFEAFNTDFGKSYTYTELSDIADDSGYEILVYKELRDFIVNRDSQLGSLIGLKLSGDLGLQELAAAKRDLSEQMD